MIRCYITDSRTGDPYRSAERAIQAGVDWIQIREKHLSGRALYAMARSLRTMTAGTRTRLLINDRLDIALAAELDGVHLPSTGLPLEVVRPRVPFVGVSTHSLEEAVAAEQGRADYVIFGPVFETPGKSPVGLDALKRVVAAVRIPVIGIGGIDARNAHLVAEAGAAGVAAIRWFQATT